MALRCEVWFFSESQRKNLVVMTTCPLPLVSLQVLWSSPQTPPPPPNANALHLQLRHLLTPRKLTLPFPSVTQSPLGITPRV